MERKSKICNGGLKGAITGDIVGSIYEWDNHRDKDFPLFADRCFFTDDTVMSVAVAHAISIWLDWTESDIDNHHLEWPLVRCMQEFGRAYPGRGYGGHFAQWIHDPDPQPYNSWGNGAPMRCSAAGMVAQSAKMAYRYGEITSAVTHNHPNAMLAAGLTAELIWRARHGESMEELRRRAEAEYEIHTCEEYQKTNEFSEASHLTMPPALAAFLESTSFEDAIRNAISVGGDSDTIAAITGSLAEAYWGIPDDIWEKAESFLDERLKTIVRDFYDSVQKAESRESEKKNKDISSCAAFVDPRIMFSSDGANYEGAPEGYRIKRELENVRKKMSDEEIAFVRQYPEAFPLFQKRYHMIGIIECFMRKVFWKLDHIDHPRIESASIKDIYDEIPEWMKPRYHKGYKYILADMFKSLFRLSVKIRSTMTGRDITADNEEMRKDSQYLAESLINFIHSDFHRHTREAEAYTAGAEWNSRRAAHQFLKENPHWPYGRCKPCSEMLKEGINAEDSEAMKEMFLDELHFTANAIVQDDDSVFKGDIDIVSSYLLEECNRREIYKLYYLDPALMQF